MDKKMLGGLAAGGAALAGLAAYLVIGRKPEPPIEPVASPPAVSEPAPAATAPAPAEPEAAPAVPAPKQPGTAKKAPAPKGPAKTGTPGSTPASPKSGESAPSPATANAPPKPKPAPKPVYSGPKEGVVLWSGELIKGGKIIIAPGIAAGGTVSNEFPGVPIDVRVDLKGVSITESPSAADGWKRVVLSSETKGRKVVSVHWAVRETN